MIYKMKKNKTRGERNSLDKFKIYPDPHRSEDIALSRTNNQITIIHTENQTERSPNDCRRASNILKGPKIIEYLESKKVTITMSIITVYTLFVPDIQAISAPKSADDAFSSVIVACLFLFSVELILSFVYKPDYKWSFYFYLDFLATLSLFADITWVWDSMIGVSTNSSNKNTQLQNAENASNAGTRTSRILRIIRLIRLIRLVKLYKNAQIAIKQRENEEEDGANKSSIIVGEKETKVGKKLSELTMKRVIFIVLIMLLILPFFDTGFYFTAQTSWVFGLTELTKFVNVAGFDDVKNEYILYHTNNNIRPIIYLSYSNSTGSYIWQEGILYANLRYNEIYTCSINGFISIFDIRYDSKLSSLLNIIKTIYICIALSLAAIYFTKDSDELVIKPIEKIIDKVRKITKNPMNASDIKTIQPDRKYSQKKCFDFCNNPDKEKERNEYEIKLIENNITKIGILLALGFGEAGSAIIGQNIERAGCVDPMIEGNKIIGIFGFCDIRNFTDTTEELQEGVMMFVNEIAQIVHGVVDKYFGSANKNIGDAFLVVWKFTSDEFFLDDDVIIRNAASKRAHYMPDMALLSFLKILAKINKDPAILKYRSHQKILQRMPNYEVKLGFGLHLGWAIEGAIGSQFKVDASYLSPHVNIASALEGSTKLYGVPLLISGNLYDVFSEDVQAYCRKIDVIRLKGNSQPFSLYTSDCDFSGFSAGNYASRKKTFFRNKKKNLQKKFESKDIETVTCFKESKEINLMRKGLLQEFFDCFNQGLENYINGDWEISKLNLLKALEIKRNDGPSLSLINYMSDYEYKCPENWSNSRYLG